MKKKNKKDYKYRVLLISPSFEEKGGVTEFCKMIVSHISSNFRINQLIIRKKVRNKGLLIRLVSIINTACKLIKNLKKYNYDIIQLNPSFRIYSILRDSIYLLIINRSGYGEKTVVFFHGWSPKFADKIIKISLFKLIFSKIFNKVKFISVLFKRCKDQLILMGIDPRKIQITTTMYEKNHYKKASINKTKKVNILFLSRLLKEKGVFIAAEVGKLLIKNNCKDLELKFAGDGPEYKNLKKYIIESGLDYYFKTLGHITGEKKRRLLNESDIFLFPTYCSEGCPIVILEAMGAGLAIVSRPVGAIPNIVKHNVNGFLIDSKDPHEFYKVTRRLIEDRELLYRIQKLNKHKAEKNYDANVVIKKIETIYRSVIHD
ncbi:MAG: glycosyltransferase family 4 protein [Promethearchaeota archaeon]